MDTAKKKALVSAYKSKKDLGGVYILENRENGRCLLKYAADIKGAENRFMFSKSTGSCVEPRLQNDWGDGSGFCFSVVDTLEKSEDWDKLRFAEELKALAALWKDKLQKDWY
ncbi:MAG: GIY-YIG nuclease family protein [Oscillospiraceae bacterium]|jgi:hypothetical protein